MFEALSEFVRNAGKVAVTLAMKDDQMVVVVMPMTVSKEAVINQPLTLTGSPQELDEAFVEAITNYTAARRSLVEQVESTVAILEAAKKESAGKAQKALSGKAKALSAPKATVASRAENDDGDEEEDDDVIDVPASVPPAKETPPAGTDLFALLA